MAKRWQQFSLRFLIEFTFVVAAGCAGIQAVYLGEANQWTGFNVREGYWGTPDLYGLPDAEALRIVSAFWFVYATLIAIGLVLVLRRCFRRDRQIG